MSMVINSNIATLNAQRNLGTSQSSLSTSMQRLSSGLRINSAKDDAAGLAITERMTAQVRGLNQAARNANDGVSLMQTAEGALGTIGNNLQRIRELAVQSRNATNSSEDREALQKEVKQLKDEIDRVAQTTSFNGTKLLNGSFTSKSFQVGANAGERIDVDKIVNAQVSNLGERHELAGATFSAGTAASFSAAGSATAPVFASQAAVTLSVGTDTFALGSLAAVTGDVPTSSDTGHLAEVAKSAITQRLNDAIAEIEAKTGGKVTATIHKDGNKLEFSGSDEIKFSATYAGSGTAASSKFTGFSDVTVATEDGADKAIKQMDAALKAVNSARADLGALQNRFESVVSNLNVNSENLSASRSRILDADFASETANLSRAQILQQAGTAMIAQANQLPQQVLSLLR